VYQQMQEFAMTSSTEMQIYNLELGPRHFTC